MSEIDLTQLKSVIQPFVPLGRSGLLPALHAAQKIHGWLPQEVAAEVAKLLRVPLADVHGVIEFYAQPSLRRQPSAWSSSPSILSKPPLIY
jgi:NADH:ubiquinone oxidoreductase subunit E